MGAAGALVVVLVLCKVRAGTRGRTCRRQSRDTTVGVGDTNGATLNIQTGLLHPASLPCAPSIGSSFMCLTRASTAISDVGENINDTREVFCLMSFNSYATKERVKR